MRATALTLTIEFKPPQAYFDLIYTGAKEKDAKKIEEALLHVSINVRDVARGTPARQLAFECTPGSKEALDFLMMQNPLEQLALWKEMAVGYAQGGHKEELKRVLAMAGSASERQILEQGVMYGHILGGHKEQVNAEMERFKGHRELREIVAMLYAREGHVKLADELLEGANSTEQFSLLRPMIKGYSQSGNEAQANRMLEKVEVNSIGYWNLLADRIAGCAEGGYQEQMNGMLAIAVNDVTMQIALLQFALHGCAKGGHAELVKEMYRRLLQLVAPLSEGEKKALQLLIRGSADGGYVGLANEILKHVLGNSAELTELFLKDMADIYVRNNLTTQVNMVLEMAKRHSAEKSILNVVANGLAAKNVLLDSNSTLQALALLNPKVHLGLATELKETKKGMNIDVMALVPKATQINQLITRGPLNTSPFGSRVKLGAAWVQLELRELILMTGVDLVRKRKLNYELLLSIATFLSPLSYGGVLDLSHRMFREYRPNKNLSNTDGARQSPLLTTTDMRTQDKNGANKKLRHS